MSRRRLLAPLCIVASCACASTPSSSSSTASPAAARASSSASEAAARRPSGSLVRGDGKVGAYVSSKWGFSTSSYFVEGEEGVVLVDVQFLPSAAEEAVDLIEAATGKKVVAAVVLHANPDKFNGTAALQRRGISVTTSAQVKALIPSVHEKRVRAFYERYQPDYPSELPAPDVFGDRTTTLPLAGMTFTAHVLGPGCSEAHVVLEHEGHVFVGDLVAHGAHSWLEIGKTDEWLRRLAEIRALSPTRVHPGRGLSGGPELLDAEEAYLRRVIEIVAAERPTSPDDKAGVRRAIDAVKKSYPDLAFPFFLEIGVPAEWRRQATLNATSPAARP